MDDSELKALLAADAPPARDLRFELAVMARVEREAFHRALWRNAGFALLAALVLVLVAPPLEAVWQQSIAPAISNLTIVALLLIATLFWGRFFAGQD